MLKPESTPPITPTALRGETMVYFGPEPWDGLWRNRLEYYGVTGRVRRALEEDERELLRRADICIVVSENLYMSKSRFASRMHLVPNAVDYQAFRAHHDMPEDLRRLRRPLIGYSGLISDRLNLSLLSALARQRPEWTLTLVGDVVDARCEEEMAALQRLSNVVFLGRKSVDELPAYVASFDVGIIPYKVDGNADHCSPLKMYEYMAANIPIVATSFAVARQFSDAVRIAEDVSHFEEVVQQALQGAASEPKLRLGNDSAASNTWDQRIVELSKIVLAGRTSSRRSPAHG